MEENTGIAIVMTIFVILAIIITAFVVPGLINATGKSKCLDNENARRWHSSICEQYNGEQWGEISLWEKEPRYFYNAKGARINE